ncbi:MAG: chemotaxis response regulator protein-glutamate methylesterase [Acidobacteriota bacterium]
MAADCRTRILIVDDSAVMRSLLRSAVSSDPHLQVAGTAADGQAALSSLDLLRPDLILLDVEMPVMDGLATLRELRRRGHTMPVVMCSSLTQRGAKVTIEALACGASDYVAKPAGEPNRESAIRTLARELVPRIHAVTSKAHKQPQPLFSAAPDSPANFALPLPKIESPRISPTVLVVGVSTGGPAALELLLPALPAGFPLPVLIVQHMPALFTGLLAERLSTRCALRVREAAEGEPVRAGTAWIARGDWHMEVLSPGRSAAPPTLYLHQGPLENHCRPAVDVLFRSAAKVCGAGVLAVVLTGMGSDGLKGCRSIREQGGIVFAQDQATSIVWGMPGAVASAGLAHRVLPLDALATEILRIVGGVRHEQIELRGRMV